MYIQAAAARTRATATPAEVALSAELGLQPVTGPGGANEFQTITGWARTKCKVSLAIKIPWVTTYETWWDTDNDAITGKHALFTCSTTNGRTVGFYCPNIRPSGKRPSDVVEVAEQNYVEVMFNCSEGATTTTELTRSAVRFFAG